MSVAELTARGALLVEDGNHGEYRPRSDEFTDDGTAFVRAADIANGEIDFTGAGKINEVAMARIRKGVGRPGDVLLTHKGTVGRVALVPDAPPDFVCSPQTTFWRVLDHTVLDRRFLRYSLSSPEVQSQLDTLKGQSDMAPYVSLTDQRTIRLKIPPVTQQHAIGEVLGALDDKVAANGRVCESIKLDLQLQYKRSVAVDSVVSDLESVASFHNRRRVPLSARDRDLRPGAVPYYGATGVFGYVDSPIFDEQLILVGEDGSVVTADGHPVVQYIWGPSWVNNHAHVLTGLGISTELLGVALRDADVRHLVTGAVQPKLSMGKLKSLRMSFPTGEALDRLERLSDCEMALIRSLTVETRILAELRDTLLPHLMSGRLRVGDAEKQVEDVV